MSTLYERPLKARDVCGPVGGINKRDQRDSGWQMALKHTDRTSIKVDQARKVRALNSGAKPTGGYVREAQPSLRMSKNARRKARRYGR